MLLRIESVFQFRPDELLDFCCQRLIGRRRRHRSSSSGWICAYSSFCNRDDLLDRLMAEIQRFDHDFFGNFLGARFDHDDAVFHSGDGQIQPAVLQFRISGIDDVAAVDQSDANRRDRAW